MSTRVRSLQAARGRHRRRRVEPDRHGTLRRPGRRSTTSRPRRSTASPATSRSTRARSRSSSTSPASAATRRSTPASRSCIASSTPKGVVVLGFPSNDFGGQEPGTAEEIPPFCKTKYDVTFPLFEKGVTKAGPTQSPIYQFLGATGNLPGWNFCKYVVDKKGKVVAFFPSKVTPDARS